MIRLGKKSLEWRWYGEATIPRRAAGAFPFGHDETHPLKSTKTRHHRHATNPITARPYAFSHDFITIKPLTGSRAYARHTHTADPPLVRARTISSYANYPSRILRIQCNSSVYIIADRRAARRICDVIVFITFLFLYK